MLEEYYFDMALRLEGLKNTDDLTTAGMEEIGRLEKLLADDEEISDGPTGDPWIDDFLTSEDAKDFEWVNTDDSRNKS